MSNITSSELPSSASIDIFADSHGYVITTLYPKNKSKTYRPCVEVSKRADKYMEFRDGDDLFHYACFGSAVNQLSNALFVLKYLDNLQSAQFFAKGRSIEDIYHVKRIIDCAITAHNCTDRRAHCWKMVRSPFESGKHIAFPCDYLNQQHYTFNFMPSHPSSPKDQIQAFAVKMNVDLCPFFSLDAFEGPPKKDINAR